MKTIAVLHRGGDTIRGSEVCLLHSITAMKEAGYRVILIANSETIILKAREHGIDADIYCSFPELMIDGRQVSLPLIAYLRELWRLTRFLKHHGPDVLYCNGGLPCQLAVPVAKLTNSKVLCHFHHPASKRYFYLWLVTKVDCLVFPSQFTAEHVFNKCSRKGRVIYNAVDLHKEFTPAIEKDKSLRKDLGIPSDATVIGQIGALTRNKRSDFLIKCMAPLLRKEDDLYLVIIGRGELKDELEKLIQAEKLTGKVLLTGFVEKTDIYLKYVLDIHILASLEEGLGISVIEAAGCGIPSIVSDSTGLREVVEHLKTGLRFKPDDEGQLKAQVEQLYSNTNLRTQLGEQARIEAVKKFSLDQYKKDIVDTIQKISS